MSIIVFDIETGPVPDAELEELFTKSFDESTVKGFDLLSKEFDPAEVKTGNMKDPGKIKEKIEAAREKFETEKTGAKVLIETSRVDAWEKFKQRAALSPLTGQVLAIGYHCDAWEIPQAVDFQSETKSEKELVTYALECIDSIICGNGRVIGHNIIGFDLPFLIRRGLKYGIKPPRSIVTQLQQYRPLAVIDTIKEWQCGNRSEAFVKLDDLAAFFGGTRKNGHGENFHKLFHGTPNEQLDAIRYLENDITMTVEVAEKLGVLHG